MEIASQPFFSERERKYVLDTYSIIAPAFSHTRGYLWQCIQDGILAIQPHDIVIEVGCGNGKNIRSIVRRDVYSLGVDIIPYFLEETYVKGKTEACLGSNIKLPLRSGIAQMVWSVAVIHHLDSCTRRIQALHELLRIVAPGGHLLVVVWALEQEPESKRQFLDKPGPCDESNQDRLIDWNNPEKTQTHYRYYHLFKKGELEGLLYDIPLFCNNFTMCKTWYERGNWVIYSKRST